MGGSALIVISVANQKGGVGKTTTVHALAAGLANNGHSTLCVDFDPQGNLSAACGADNQTANTINDVLKNKCSASAAVQKVHGINDFNIIPSNIMLAAAEQYLSAISAGREHRLRESLAPIMNDYDFIIIDTPPSLGILSVNAFVSSDYILIPSNTDYFATAGIKLLHDTFTTVKKYCNPKLEIAGILITRFNGRTNLAKQFDTIIAELGRRLDIHVYSTHIRNSVSSMEAAASRSDIFSMSNNSIIAEDYSAFISEFLKGITNEQK